MSLPIPPELPYPPVFHDWRPTQAFRRVTSQNSNTGVEIQMLLDHSMRWHIVELTEDDACRLAALLLLRAGRKGLANRVLRKIAEDIHE
jgi:hypothetical protein